MRLKQSTAVAISFGPAVDPTDGVTLVTGLVSALDHASTGIKLSKNGGALTIRHATVTASSYDGYGNYIVTLDTTDTDTLGTLRMQFAAAASCVPVWMDFEVVNANEWDSSFGTTVRKFTDVDQIKTNAVVNGGTITFPTTATLASTTNITGGTITTATNVTTVNGLAANVITATSIAADAITDAKVASDVTIASVTGAVGSVTGAVGSVTGNVGGNVTGTIGGMTAAALKDFFDTDSGTTYASAIDGSVVKEIATNSGGASAPTADEIADEVQTRTIARVTLVDTTTAITNGTLTAGERNSVADAILARSLGSETYAAQGAVPTLAQSLFMLFAATSQFAITSTTISAKKLDGTTEAMTFTLDDATTPTSRVRAT